MSKNLPDSCSEHDPSAPWNYSTVKCKYNIFLKIGKVIFKSEVIEKEFEIPKLDIKSDEEYWYLENDLYEIIDDELDEEYKEFDYRIDLIGWSYDA